MLSLVKNGEYLLFGEADDGQLPLSLVPWHKACRRLKSSGQDSNTTHTGQTAGPGRQIHGDTVVLFW